MSYTVLARKWRPRSFEEMVGQEHVLQALSNGLDADRVHHAFLFTGTRGVGKTTVARILARCLNCEQGVSATPCGECSACREIDEGRFVDLIEVDAASRTRVDDTRELLDNVQYAPSRGRYKVYLIDEVHMLSKHSFNALLKTLEEPPPHVKFLLATTDPQQLPVTVLSRCLQFNLKRMTPGMIQSQLAKILEAEGIEFEAQALELLARAAEGSMRDGLSLLDQAIAFGAGRVRHDDVRVMLGTIDRDHVWNILKALADSDQEALTAALRRLDERAPDYAGVLEEMAVALQQVGLHQHLPDALEAGAGEREQIAALAQGIAAEDIQLWYQIALIGRRDLPLAPEPRGGFEMVILRMLAFRPDSGGGSPAPGQSRARAAGAAAAVQSAPASAAPAAPAPAVEPASPTATESPDTAPPGPVSEVADDAPVAAAGSDWVSMVQALNLRGAAQQLAVNCWMQGREGNKITLQLDPVHANLRLPAAEKRLLEALRRFHDDAELKLDISVAEGEGETPARREERRQDARKQSALEAVQSDPNVRALEQTFGARLNPDSVKPLD